MGLAIVAGLLACTPSGAQAAWCATYRNGGTNCGFANQSQCQASVSGAGGWCNQSPDQAGASSERATRRASAPAKPKSRSATRPQQSPTAAVAAPAAPTARPQAPVPAAAAAPVTSPPATASPPAGPAIAARPSPAAGPLDARAFAAARQLILDGQYQAGLAAMRNLRAEGHPDVASYIGLAYRKLGRNDEARAWYDRALVADPRHLQTLAFSGVLRVEQGDVAGARLELQKIRLICGNTSCNEYVGLSGVIAGKAR